MDADKKARLEAKGWKVGRVEDFLDLSPEESAYVELLVLLANSLRERRKAANLTQTQLAELLGSSQSRVSKMEAAESSVSLDHLIRSHLKLGVSIQELGELLTHRAP